MIKEKGRYFVMVLNNLKAEKNRLAEKKSGSVGAAYQDGLKILQTYKLSPSISKLEQAGKKFVEVLEYNSEHAPALMYLSYIFFAIGNLEMAMKYMLRAENFVFDLPPNIQRYRETIEKKISQKTLIRR